MFRPLLPAAACVTMLACSHGDSFVPVPQTEDQPMIPLAFPVRLTFNRGHDQEASWLPDGSGLLYTAEQFRYDEGDWCLSLLPPTGGRVTRKHCASSAAAGDSVNAWHWGVVGPGGLIIYARESSPAGQLAPRTHELVLASWSAPEQATVLANLPFTFNGQLYGGFAQARWLDSSTVVLRGDVRGYPAPCSSCIPDTIMSGRSLLLLRLTAQGGPALEQIPQTEYATSVAVRSADVIYYTRGSDTRVFSRVLSTGDTATVWDFGGPLARGVHVVGDRMVATVGGNAFFAFDPPFNDSTLRDGGGILHFVDLVARVGGVVDQFALYRHPALSPDGRRVVVENTTRAPDLFFYSLP